MWAYAGVESGVNQAVVGLWFCLLAMCKTVICCCHSSFSSSAVRTWWTTKHPTTHFYTAVTLAQHHILAPSTMRASPFQPYVPRPSPPERYPLCSSLLLALTELAVDCAEI
jgi:hypothetical protein